MCYVIGMSVLSLHRVYRLSNKYYCPFALSLPPEVQCNYAVRMTIGSVVCLCLWQYIVCAYFANGTLTGATWHISS